MDVGGVLVAQVPVFLESLINDFLQFWREVRIKANSSYRNLFQNRVKDDTETLSPEWQSTCRHFIKDDTEREQIRPCIQFLGSNLFRRHIGDSAQGATRTR